MNVIMNNDRHAQTFEKLRKTLPTMAKKQFKPNTFAKEKQIYSEGDFK